MRHRRWAVLTACVLVIAGCGSGGTRPVVSDARIGQPTGPNAALYFTATGYGEADTLISATTGVAAGAELHETLMGERGTMSMQPLSSLEVPARGDLVLAPGGYHIMLLDVDRLDVGDEVEVTLTWQTAGEMTIVADVVGPADTMSGDMDDMESDG